MPKALKKKWESNLCRGRSIHTPELCMPLNLLLFFMRRCFSGCGDEREITYVTMLLSLSQETVMLFRLQRGVS